MFSGRQTTTPEALQTSKMTGFTWKYLQRCRNMEMYSKGHGLGTVPAIWRI